MQSVIISITGRVQGVGFRWATARLAKQFDIVGWGRNDADGSVTVRAQGNDSNMTSFISALKQRPTPYARVTQVTVTPQSVETFKKFRITD